MAKLCEDCGKVIKLHINAGCDKDTDFTSKMLTRIVVIIDFHCCWLETHYFHFLLHRETVVLSTPKELESERERVLTSIPGNSLAFFSFDTLFIFPLRPSTDTLLHTPALFKTAGDLLSSHRIQVEDDFAWLKFHLFYMGFVFQLLEYQTKRHS